MNHGVTMYDRLTIAALERVRLVRGDARPVDTVRALIAAADPAAPARQPDVLAPVLDALLPLLLTHDGATAAEMLRGPVPAVAALRDALMAAGRGMVTDDPQRLGRALREMRGRVDRSGRALGCRSDRRGVRIWRVVVPEGYAVRVLGAPGQLGVGAAGDAGEGAAGDRAGSWAGAGATAGELAAGVGSAATPRGAVGARAT